MTNKKILILGKGLIGSAIKKILEIEGYDRVTTINSSDIDLTQPASTLSFFQKIKPDYVVNAAGKVGGIIENSERPADFLIQNLLIQLSVIQACHKTDVKKMIFFGSSCMYPKHNTQPMSINTLMSGKLEKTSLAYSIAKISGMQLCDAYNMQYNKKSFITLIPNSVYGENDNFNPKSGHVLSSLIKKFHDAKIKKQKIVELYGDGTPKREFIFSDDLAYACLKIFKLDCMKVLTPINIGPGYDISIKDLADLIAKIIGYQGGIDWNLEKPNGTPQKLLDSNYIRSLGWKPKVSLEKGIKKTYNWFLKNPSI